MKRAIAWLSVALILVAAERSTCASAYTIDATVPLAAGCPQPDRQFMSLASPLSPRWSTALPTAAPILSIAPPFSSAQVNEISDVIAASFGAWAGVSGTRMNSASYPGVVVALTSTTEQNACTDDAQDNIDGIDTICLNQSSTAFTTGVLAFTRVITANAPGVSVGASGPAAFAGQILDSDTLFCNTGQVQFATAGALGTPQGQGAYDLESLLIHELGHWFGLDHSAVWRSIMFPFAPPPGEFLGQRPTSQAPDAPLADDDRTGVRAQYPDPEDAVNIGTIRGKILPANPFSLATMPEPYTGGNVTGIFGAHIVAVDTSTGSVIAGMLGGWSCGVTSSFTQFDGSYEIDRLPVGHSYIIYAEPLVSLVGATNLGDSLNDLCAPGASPACTTPALNTNFNPRIRPGSP